MEQSSKMNEKWMSEKYDERQLRAIVEVLESFDTQEWDVDLDELGLCDASADVASALKTAREVLQMKEACKWIAH